MNHFEDLEQATFFAWLSHQYPDVDKVTFHVPNGGKRGIKEAVRLKSQGVKAGVPDIFCAVPIHPFAGLFIEFKRPRIAKKPKPILSDIQKERIELFKKRGYACFVCFGFEEAKEVMTNYLQQQICF